MLDLNQLTPEKIEVIIRAGLNKTEKIYSQGRQILSLNDDTGNLKKTDQLLLELYSYSKSIFNNLRKDPESIQTASHFLPYYLNSAMRLAAKMIDISSTKKIIHQSEILFSQCKKNYFSHWPVDRIPGKTISMLD